MEQTNNHSAASPLRIYIIIIVAGMVMTFTVIFSFVTGNRMSSKYAGLIDAAMEIKYEITTFHLWLEEAITGGRSSDFESAIYHLEEAEWYVNSMIEGGENEEGTFYKLEDPVLIHALEDIKKELTVFRNVSSERIASLDISGVDSEIDQRFDKIYDELIAMTDDIETLLQSKLWQDLVYFNYVQIFLIILCISLTLIIGVVFYRFDTRRKMYVIKLIESSRQTELEAIAREKMTVELQESEKKFRHLFDNMSSGFALHEIITDDSGAPIDYRFLDINRSFEKLTGLKKEELVGKTVLEALPGTEMEFIEKYGDVALTGEPIEFEQNATESNKYYHINAYCPDKGKFAVIFSDVSDKKIADQELKDFVYTVSHDLKAPLRKLDGFAKLLETEYKDNLDDEAFHYIDRIMGNTQQMKLLIDDLLELSRIGKTDLDVRNLSVESVIDDVLGDLKDAIFEKKAVIHIAENMPSVRMNKTRLSQIFRNLIGNSMKFSREGVPTEIEIGYTINPRNICMFVKDNGIGIEQEYYTKIFSIFQRLHKKEDFEGTGIGLTIIKRIVANMGGNVWVESEFGKGSTFYFTLPK
ncbi:ATP-binding protein [Candidatus Latescibacterota bacterium]